MANPLRANLVEKIGDYCFWDAVWLDETLSGGSPTYKKQAWFQASGWPGGHVSLGCKQGSKKRKPIYQRGAHQPNFIPTGYADGQADLLEWRRQASDDLADLVGYIADGNPDAAQALKDEIESKAAK